MAYITTSQLNNVLVSINDNFSKKKDTVKKVEIKNVLSSTGLVAEDGLYLVVEYDDSTATATEYTLLDFGSGSGIKKLADETEKDDYLLNEAVVGDIAYYNNEYFKVVEDAITSTLVLEKLIDDSILKDLTYEELFEDLSQPTVVTGYKLCYKTKPLAYEEQLLKINDTITKDDTNATKVVLSAQKVLTMIEALSGADMSMYLTKPDVYIEDTAQKYVRCDATDTEAIVVDSTNEATIIVDVPDITIGETVKLTDVLVYGDPKFIEKESIINKTVLEKLEAINIMNEVDTNVVDRIDLVFNGETLLTDANLTFDEDIIDMEELFK